MDQNTLAQWMDFYNKNLATPYDTQGPSAAQNMAYNKGAALQFALRMGGNQMPSMPQPQNYFANLPGPQPGAQIGSNPYAANLAAPRAQFAAPQMGNNYLARMLK